MSRRPAQPRWQNLRGLFAVLALTMWVGACSSVPKTIAPSAVRAAELALRGEHSAAAREYDALAAGRVAEGDEFRLLATEQWLSASDPTNAMVSLRSIVGPLAPTDAYARDLFAIEINVLQAEYAVAWQALANLPAPRGDAQTERFHALRQRTAIAVGEPIEAIRSSRQRESLARDSRQVAALRTELLNQLRRAVAAGARFDPKLAGRDRIARGWLEAAELAALSVRQSREVAAQTTSTWRRRYPGHPAAVILASLHREAIDSDLSQAPARVTLARPASGMETAAARGRAGLGSQTQSLLPSNAHVAALLPLSGRNARIGGELRDGMLSAFYRTPTEQRIPLRFYDTQRDPLFNLLRKATEDGAVAIIGPLLKDDVTEMARLQPTLPVLALNALPDATPSPSNRFLQFALAPEDEARAIARRAIAEGRTRAVAIVPSGDWGNRVLAAFREALEQGGGELLAETRIAAADPASRELATAIQGAMRIGQSFARHRQLQSELNLPLAFQPRRRGDVDFLFVPASSRLLRQVRPQLRFQAVADIPTYSISDAWSGTTDEELGELLFVDMPWMIGASDAQHAGLRNEAAQTFGASVLQSRLFAMGHDAWSLYPALLSASPGQALTLPESMVGLTGMLSIDPNGRILRNLQWASLNRQGELDSPGSASGAASTPTNGNQRPDLRE